MFWSSKPAPPPVVDTTEAIHLSDDGSYTYSLVSRDPVEEEAVKQRIYQQLERWMVQDIVTESSNTEGDATLSRQLAYLDIKFLPHQRDALKQLLTDTTVSLSAARFFDVLTYIYTTEPLWVFELLTGKFLYSQLYILPKTITVLVGEYTEERQLPTKEEWVETLAEYPWIPLLIFIQQISDDIIVRHNQAQAT